MSDPRHAKDKQLSRIYSEAGWPEPRQQIDEAILAASRRAARSRPRSFARRWAAPVALAATVVLSFTLALVAFEQQSGWEMKQLLYAPEPQAPRAPAAPPAARSVPPAPAKPGTERAPESALAKGAPQVRADADAPKKLDSNRAQPGAAGRAEERFAPEPMPAPRPSGEVEAVRAAPAAPPPGADALSGATGAMGIRGTILGAAGRSPEAWLEDIRKLKTQGNTAEAERELAEFKRRYPDYRLPDDLR